MPFVAIAVIWLLAFTIVDALGCKDPIASLYATAASARACVAVVCAAPAAAAALAACDAASATAAFVAEICSVVAGTFAAMTEV